LNEAYVDPRGQTIPDPPVSSLDELLEQNKALVAPVKSSIVSSLDEEKVATSSTDIDISKLDIRVGVVRKAWEHDEADALFCEEIDIGEPEGPRQIASGLRQHYKLEDLEGQRVLVVANLKARKLMGFQSHGMVLCASSSDGKVKFVDPPEGAHIGERVVVEGYSGEPATENQLLKKKMLDVILPDLTTDDDGLACYKKAPLQTSAGPCRSSISDGTVG
jgi:aminoacyl tRNA synthase complex-interacting multifunctional protein 1